MIIMIIIIISMIMMMIIIIISSSSSSSSSIQATDSDLMWQSSPPSPASSRSPDQWQIHTYNSNTT